MKVSRNRNRLVAVVAARRLGGMVGLTFAAAPLYSLFCQATGYAAARRSG